MSVFGLLFGARKTSLLYLKTVKVFPPEIQFTLFLLHFYLQPIIQRLMQAYSDSDHLRPFCTEQRWLLYCYGARVQAVMSLVWTEEQHPIRLRLCSQPGALMKVQGSSARSFSVCGGIAVKDLSSSNGAEFKSNRCGVCLNQAFRLSYYPSVAVIGEMWLRSALYYILEILRGYWNECQCLSCS